MRISNTYLGEKVFNKNINHQGGSLPGELIVTAEAISRTTANPTNVINEKALEVISMY